MTVTTSRDGHLAIVTFARPPLNFADLELIEGIGAAFDAADAERQVRAIVLRSEGRVFCAGADLANANPVAEDAAAALAAAEALSAGVVHTPRAASNRARSSRSRTSPANAGASIAGSIRAGHPEGAPTPSASPASSSRTIASCCAPGRRRGGASPRRWACRRRTAKA